MSREGSGWEAMARGTGGCVLVACRDCVQVHWDDYVAWRAEQPEPWLEVAATCSAHVGPA